MIKKMQPQKLFRLLMIFTVLWGVMIAVTDYERLFFGYFLILGTVFLVRPKLLYQFLRKDTLRETQENQDDHLGTVFGFFGVVGGIVLLVVGLVGLYITRNW